MLGNDAFRLKQIKSLSEFKAEIKKRNPKNRPCRHCKAFEPDVFEPDV